MATPYFISNFNTEHLSENFDLPICLNFRYHIEFFLDSIMYSIIQKIDSIISSGVATRGSKEALGPLLQLPLIKLTFKTNSVIFKNNFIEKNYFQILIDNVVDELIKC